MMKIQINAVMWKKIIIMIILFASETLMSQQHLQTIHQDFIQ